MRQWRIAAAVAGMLGMAVLAVDPRPVPAQRRGNGGKVLAAAPVVVSRVIQVRAAPTFENTGLIQPVEKALLSADVNGRVHAIRKRTGDRVKAGETLAVLENPDLALELGVLRSKVKETRAELALNRQKQKRVESLFKKKLVSAQQYEDGRLTVRMIEARLGSDLARVRQFADQLARMAIKAPIAGQIVSAELEIGQWISPNKPLYEIYSYDGFEVLVGVPGRYLPDVPEAGRVAITVPEFDRQLEGEIKAVIRTVDSRNGNFTLRVRVHNPKALPLSGLLARVQVPLGRSAAVLTVPRDAIVRQGESTHVVLVRDGKAAIVPVEVGDSLHGSVIVTGKGLRPDEVVVVRGNERLVTGMPVEVTGSIPNSGV
jgi:RND family efflux transporter MFP subunit